MRKAGLAVLCLVAGVVGSSLLAGAATAGPHHKHHKKAKPHKVTICHRTGEASYVRIRISNRALKAHLKHGDAYPGATVTGGTLNSDCTVVPPPPPEPTRYTSSTLNFGPNGWGGWSCPTGMKAVGGGTTLTTVTAQGIAQPGATIGGETYPVFP